MLRAWHISDRFVPMKLMTLALVVLPQTALAADLCSGNTYRCWQWNNCSINGEVKPCAYGSSGATNGTLRFAHEDFQIEWQDAQTATVRFGKHGEFVSKAEVTRNSDGTLVVLREGTRLFYSANRHRKE